MSLPGACDPGTRYNEGSEFVRISKMIDLKKRYTHYDVVPVFNRFYAKCKRLRRCVLLKYDSMVWSHVHRTISLSLEL